MHSCRPGCREIFVNGWVKLVFSAAFEHYASLLARVRNNLRSCIYLLNLFFASSPLCGSDFRYTVCLVSVIFACMKKKIDRNTVDLIFSCQRPWK